MAAAIEKHVHKLKRHRFKSGNEVYFCTLDCNYKISPALAVGKKTICHRCGEVFTMNEYSIRLARPHCDKCHKSKIQSEIIINSNMSDYKFDEPIQMPAPENLRTRLSNVLNRTARNGDIHDGDDEI